MRRLLVLPLCAALALVAHLPAQAQQVTVAIADRLQPANLEVRVGSTVTWRNTDGDRHRVRSTTSPQRLDSGNLETGETWTFTFRTPGTYHYLDAREDDDAAYHGTVTVTPRTGSGSGGSTNGGGGESGVPSSATTGSDSASSSVEVALVDRSFSPASIQVPAGTTVRWSNVSDRDHNVTAEDGSFSSGEVAEGGHFSHTFGQEGTFGYFCSLHSGMRGTVVVGAGARQPARQPDTADSSSGDGGDRALARVDQGEPPPDGGGTLTIVEARDFLFFPQQASIAVGDTVEWANVGEAPHTITGEGGAFDSGTVDSGERFRHRFDEPGSYPYLCAFHPQMVGRIEVTEAGEGREGGEARSEIVRPDADVFSGQVPGGSIADADGASSDTDAADTGQPPAAAAGAGSPLDDGRTPLALVIALAAIAVLVPASVLVGASRVAGALRPGVRT